MQEAPHIGNMLRQYVQKRRISQSGWARETGLNPSTVATYLENPAMRVDTLFAICQTLQHNFLREIADMLPPDMEPKAATNRDAEVEALKAQIATLEKALMLVGGRS